MKAWLMVALFLGFIACSALASDDPNKVPDEFAVKILRLQKNQSDLQKNELQLQQQFQQDEQVIQQDAQAIDATKQDALKAAKKDDTWDVDLNTLTFIPKPKPVAPVKPDAPTK